MSACGKTMSKQGTEIICTDNIGDVHECVTDEENQYTTVKHFQIIASPRQV